MSWGKCQTTPPGVISGEQNKIYQNGDKRENSFGVTVRIFPSYEPPCKCQQQDWALPENPHRCMKGHSEKDIQVWQADSHEAGVVG